MSENNISELGKSVDASIKQKEAVEQRNKKRKKIYTLISMFSVIVLLANGAVSFRYIYIPTQKYKSGMEYYQQKQYDEAIACFEELKGFKNSDEMVLYSKYYIAENELVDGNYLVASNIYSELGDFLDAPEKVEIIQQKLLDEKYENAVNLFTNQDYENAFTAFEELSGYKDSNEYMKSIIDVYQDLFLQDLQTALDNRSAYDANGNYLGYEKLLSFETGLKHYSDIAFNNKLLDQYKEQYLNGVLLQEEALTYYKENPELFEQKWNEGYLERAYAIVGIYELGYRTVEEKTYHSFVKDLLEQELINCIIKQTVQGDKETGALTLRTKANNKYKCNLSDIKLNFIWNKKYPSETLVKRWNAGEEISITIQLPKEIYKDDNVAFELSLQATIE